MPVSKKNVNFKNWIEYYLVCIFRNNDLTPQKKNS